jgi:penicillin-binding protein 1C
LASAIVLDMLNDATARIPAFGLQTPFDFPFPVAVKTGTSRHFTDNWAIGTTRGFTVAVWAGNFSGRSMEGVSGITGAGPLLHRAIMATARRYQPGVLTTPADVGAINVRVCRLSGLLATNTCAQLGEWFLPGTEPTRVDDWEQGGRVTLPAEYADWSRQGLGPVVADMSLSPAAETRLIGGAETEKSDSTSEFRILSPRDGDRYAIPVGVEARYATIPLRTGGLGAKRVRWSVDGKPFRAERWSLVPGTHVIRATSENGEVAEARIVVAR